MSKALELRKKRADLWEKAKLFLDNAKRNGDVMSADNTATYANMEKKINKLWYIEKTDSTCFVKKTIKLIDEVKTLIV